MVSLFLRWQNRLIAFAFDLCMIFFAWFGSYWLSFDLHFLPSNIFEQAVFTFLPVLLLQSSMFWLLGLYRGVWRFASIPDLIRISKAVMIGTMSIFLIFIYMSFHIHRSIFILYALLLILSLTSARAFFRWLKDYGNYFRRGNKKRVLIIGAGYGGEGLVRDLLRHNSSIYQPIVLLDDNPAKQGRDIHGVRIAGGCENILEIVKNYNIELILIAIPSASSAQMRRVVNLCEKTSIPFRTLPSIMDLTDGRVDIKLFRDVSLEDLLGRDLVKIDWQSIQYDIKNKVILVSGGGGSIGSELCRQIAPLSPKQLIIIDNSEFNLYSIDMELRKHFPKLNLETILSSVTDKIEIQRIFENYHPAKVFHAAAYKHVPLLERHGRMAIYNNIIGTHIMAEAAVMYKANQFILISTDKAVNPTNLMGTTKRIAEMICQNLYDSSQTHFTTVRFGNVLDSAGSVVPLFRKQIQQGGPLSVTHPDITRYFMSIPEASQLILQAALLGEGGEIFVLDMGEPIKIRYLAEQMIRLAGKTLGKDIDIIYTGLRPGEKLYEELFYRNEKVQKTTHDKIMLANANEVDKNKLFAALTNMEKAYEENDIILLYELLKDLVPEYQMNSIPTHTKREKISIVANQ